MILDTYYTHLLCAVVLLSPLRDRLLVFFKSPRADNCFWTEEEAALDFRLLEASLRGLMDRDFEWRSKTPPDELDTFPGVCF